MSLRFAPRGALPLTPRLDEHLESCAVGEGGWVSAKVTPKLMSLHLGLLELAGLRDVGWDLLAARSLVLGRWPQSPCLFIGSRSLPHLRRTDRGLPVEFSKHFLFPLAWKDEVLEGVPPEWGWLVFL